MKKVFGIIAAALLLVSGMGAVVTAQSGEQVNNQVKEQLAEQKPFQRLGYQLKKGEVHKGALYITGGRIDIAGEVEGSVYCASEAPITISGVVHGDVLCAGASDVAITGEVKQDVRIAAVGNVAIDGTVQGDASVVSQETVSLGKGASVSGDLQTYAGTAALDGTVGKDAYLSANNTDIGASAVFMGNLAYSGISQADVNSSQVKGKILFAETEHESDRVTSTIIVLMMLLVFGLGVALVAPRYMDRSSSIARKRFGLTVLTGIGVVFITPFISLILFLTVIGIPLSLVMMALYAVVLLASVVFFAYFLGSLLLSNVKNVLLRMVGGVVFLVALYIIPIVNIIAVIATIIVGVGIAVRSATHNYRSPRYSLTPPAPMPPMPTVLAQQGEEEAREVNTPDVEKTTKPVAKKPAAKKTSTKKSTAKKTTETTKEEK